MESNSQELGDLTLNVANVRSSPGISSDLNMCIEENSGLQTERISELGETGRKLVPSYSATCSLVCTNIDTTMTNIFSTLLINGPASDYSAIFTGLLRANGVATWSCGTSSKMVVSLDLDVYEKCYMLVHSRDDLRNKYILCLGELHIVFAHIRAIGRFIEQSGMSDAWLEAEWYDSDCIVRQILECGHMKRALDAHEANSGCDQHYSAEVLY